MRFLQRLAAIAMPGAAAGDGAVRAALPSRFEPMRASALDPWDASITEPDSATSGMSADLAATLFESISPEEAPRRPRGDRGMTAVPALPASPEGRPAPLHENSAQASPRSPLHPTARSIESGQPSARGQRSRPDHPQDAGPPSLPPQPLRHFAFTEPTEGGPILPARRSTVSDLAARFASAAIPEDAAPLRAETVAAHTIATTAIAPVIHVTIDRLEVRAPAAPRPQPARTGTRAPSVSLADYLRGAGGPDRPRGRA